MKIVIEFDTDNAAFEDNPNEWRAIFLQAVGKVKSQLQRKPCLCNHPESVDKLIDSNGNTVGTVTVQGKL